MAEWTKDEFECFVKDADGFEIPVACEFRSRVGDWLEVELVSAKDSDGRKVDVCEEDRSRLENQFLWWKQRHVYGDPYGSKQDERRRIARELAKIAKDVMAYGVKTEFYDVARNAFDSLLARYPDRFKEDEDSRKRADWLEYTCSYGPLDIEVEYDMEKFYVRCFDGFKLMFEDRYSEASEMVEGISLHFEEMDRLVRKHMEEGE